MIFIGRSKRMECRGEGNRKKYEKLGKEVIKEGKGKANRETER
jgi:hypothetical protein